MNPRFTFAVGAVALVAAFPSLADDDAARVVVTATRQATRSSELLSDVSVVDQEQIEQAGAQSLPDLISTLPGIQVTRNGGAGSSGSISLRGTNSNQALVLVDGQRLSSATTGMTALEHIPLDQIDRIEVLRGPASSLYGSDAIGGVIQIFTAQGSGAPAPTFNAGVGSYGTAIGSAAYGGTVGDTSFRLQAGWEGSEGFSSIRAPKGGLYEMYNSDDDKYGNRNFSASVKQKLSDDLSFGGTLLYIDSYKYFDSSNCNDWGTVCSADYDNRQKQQLSTYSAHVAYRVAPAWKSMVRVGRSQDKTLNYRFDPTAAVVRSELHYDTTQDQIVWQNDFSLSPGNTIMASVERLKVQVDSTQTFSENEQTTRSYVLGYQGHFDAHSLQASTRVDDIQRKGRHSTGSLAYGYHFDDTLSARVAAGTAFHAPTFNDLYWPLDPVNFFQGNPNLKPEQSRNLEVGLSYERVATRAGITVYRNKIEDLIDYVPGVAPNWIGTMGNVSRATLQGISLSGAHRSGDWEFSGNLDFLSAKNDDNGKTLQRRARQTGFVEVRRHFGLANVGVQVQGVSRRFNNPANTQVLAGYGLVNIDLNYAFERDWSFVARLNNAFDRDYTLVRSTLSPYNDYGTPGRNFFVGLRYQPK